MKKKQAFIIKEIEEGFGKANGDLYRNLFKNMTKAEFEVFLDRLRGEEMLNVILPNETIAKLSQDKLEKQLIKLGGHTEFQLNYEDVETGTINRSPTPAIVMPMIIRKQTQTAKKGLSVTNFTKSKTNPLTGQVNAASKLTLPEASLLSGLGLKQTLREDLRVRADDEGAARAMSAIMATNGSVSLAALEQYSTGMTSTRTLDALFKSAHITLFDD